MKKASSSPTMALFSAVITTAVLSILHYIYTIKLIQNLFISMYVIPPFVGWVIGKGAIKALEEDTERTREEYIFIPGLSAAAGLTPIILVGIFWMIVR